MKLKIKEFSTNALSETEHSLKRLCGRLSQKKRFIIVLLTCGLLAVASLYFVTSSIMNIGKNNTKKELIKLQHIERLNFELKQ